MPVIYRVADLYVLPSKGPGETWGLALNEAMASGRAIAATAFVGGALDLIEEGINGITIDLDNDAKLKKLIDRSLINKQILVEMGNRSRLKIRTFSFQHIVSAIESVLS